MLFSQECSEGHPTYDVKPLIVTMADGRAQRLLGECHIQDHVGTRVSQHCLAGNQAGLVSGDCVTAAFLIGIKRLVICLKDDRFIVDTRGSHLIR